MDKNVDEQFRVYLIKKKKLGTINPILLSMTWSGSQVHRIYKLSKESNQYRHTINLLSVCFGMIRNNKNNGREWKLQNKLTAVWL